MIGKTAETQRERYPYGETATKATYESVPNMAYLPLQVFVETRKDT